MEDECIRLPPKPPKSKAQENIDLFQLLDSGQNDYSQNTVNDTILILGNTGSGKTTITQIVAGNLSRLHTVLTQSNDFVIVDDDNRIGRPSTTSKTLRPELVFMNTTEPDNATKTTIFYDFPGFDDTRGPEMDIAANFFMNQALKSVKRVKMLFLVIYSSVKMGNDRLDFDLLATHVTKFVKDLRKYKDAFGLIVTKVRNHNDLGNYIKDKSIIKGIVEFLDVYNNTMHSKLAMLEKSGGSSQEKEQIENKIFFVETLLEKSEDGTYPKITFSRTPEKCGPLDNSVLVAQTKWQVSRMYNDLEYTPVGKDDFGYTLKDKTIFGIQNYAANLNKKVVKRMETLMTTFGIWYTSRHFSVSADLQATAKQLDKDHLAVKAFIEDVTNSTTLVNLENFMTSFTTVLGNTGYTVPKNFTQFMNQHHTYFDFFQESVSRHNHGQGRLEDLTLWVKYVTYLHDFLKAHRDWYEFLSGLERALEGYAFHGNKEPGDVEVGEPVQWLEYIQRESIVPIGSHVVTVAGEMRSQQLLILDRLMKTALLSPEVTCSEKNNMTVRGTFVKLSDFITKNGIVFGHAACAPNKVELIQVYASHKIFIDRDINGDDKELNIVMIAPKWDVIGNVTFSLKGAQGPDVDPPTAQNGEDGDGESGKDGIEGNPGEPGGSLFGVAAGIEGSGVLNVITNGGKGGKGQNGGNGGAGGSGRNATKDNIGSWDWSTNIVTTTWKGKTSGRGGSQGGDGGTAGPGGPGGYAGFIDVVLPYGKGGTRTPQLHLVRSSGQPGEDGEVGKGGVGGRDGYGITCEKTNILYFFPYRDSCSKDTRSLREGGAAGKDGSLKDKVWNFFGGSSNSDSVGGRSPSVHFDKRECAKAFLRLFAKVIKHDTEMFMRFLLSKF